MRLPTPLVLIAIACETTEPVQLAEGSVVTAFVSFDEQHAPNGTTFAFRASFFPGEQGPPTEWESCDDTVGYGSAVFPLNGGTPWIELAGEQTPLHPERGNQWSNTLADVPEGEWFGGGWTGSDDIPAFSEGEAIRVPEAIEVRSPELDVDSVVDPTHDLVVRWTGSSPGVVYISVNDEFERHLGCRVLDDGRFEIPRNQLSGFRGAGTLHVLRSVQEFFELENGEFARFSAYRRDSGTIVFER